MLAFGNAAAALSCRKVGGRAGIPSLDEIVETLSRQSLSND
jgi:sugar/nucleoside kinase (ribokinase family)